MQVSSWTFTWDLLSGSVNLVLPDKAGKTVVYEVMGDEITRESQILWVGHVQCFIPDHEENQHFKEHLLAEYAPKGFVIIYYSGQNPDRRLTTPLILPKDAMTGTFKYPDLPCCAQFQAYKQAGG